MNGRTLPLLLLVVALASCARSPAPGAGSGGVTSTNVPPGAGGVAPLRPRIVTPSPGLADVRPIIWRTAVPSSDGTQLTVEFWGSPCLGIDHVGVEETPATVTITLYQGTLPSMVGSACPEIAVLEAVRVQLSAPLGDRRLVDGTPANPPPEPPGAGTVVGGSGAPPSGGNAGT